MEYTDCWGLYNVKPVGPEKMPSGNDGWIVSSYMEKAGHHLRRPDMAMGYEMLEKIEGSRIPKERLPGKQTPFLSRDVILGLYWLKFITVDDLIKNDWSFSPFPLPKFHLIKLICQSILCLYEDRNYFWKKEFSQIYRLAFFVPYQDRAYMLRDSGREVPWKYKFVEWISNLKRDKSISSQLIDWKKYDKWPDSIIAFTNYFGDGHPIIALVRPKYSNKSL